MQMLRSAPCFPSTSRLWPVVSYRSLTLILSLGVLFAMSTAAMAQTTGGPAAVPPDGVGQASFAAAASGPKYSPERVILRFRAGVPMAAEALTHSKTGARLLRRFRAVPGLQVVQLPPGLSVQEALFRYRGDPNIAYAEPDTFVHVLETVPNDPSFSSLWAMKNTGQSGGKIDADIDATDAWTLSTGSDSVYIGVIDTGVDYNHPDLSSNIYSSASDCNLNGVDDDEDGYVDDCHGIDTLNHDSDPMDDHNHGSHVAGIIGATGDNGVGVVGVNWRVSIIPCKFADASGSGPASAAIECLDWLATLKDHGLNIIATNNSWGGSEPSQAVADAIEASMQRGILFIAAAGNGGSDGVGDNNDTVPTFPSNYGLPNVIAVAATDHNDLLGSFSNFGQHTVDIGAPGVGILSTIRGSSYATFNGTSMATAHVTGAAALLKAQTPSLDWRAIKNLLLSSAEPIAALSGKTITGGRLNVYSAMTCSKSSLFAPLLPYGDATVVTGSTVTFAALNINCAHPAGDVTVDIDNGTEIVILRDDGANGDAVAGDGVYTGRWIPATASSHTFRFQDGSGGTIRVIAPYSAATSTTYSYRSITGTNLQLSEDGVTSLNLNTPGFFPITIGGLTFDSISISANGVLSLDNFNTYRNDPMPTSSAHVLIAPWWDDLAPQRGTDQNVFYEVTGAAPNRELVVEWRNVPHYAIPFDVTKTISFQTIFPESSPSSDILFNYADVNFDESNQTPYNAGGSATVGVQVDPTHGVQYSYNQAVLTNGLALLFQAVSGPVPAPSLTVVSPNGGESWSLGSMQTIQWSYTGMPGTSVTIELLRNASLQQTLTTTASIGSNGAGSFSWTPAATLPLDTTYTIHITSNQNSSYSDTSDASDASFSLTEPPDTTAPTVAITAPPSGSTVSGTSVTVSATATDNVGVVGVQFKLDGANLGAEITAAPYSLEWNTTIVTNGTHSLTVSARDAAGNMGVSVATTVTVSNSTEFTISVPNGSSNSATTIAGGTATYNLNVIPTTGFAGPVSFACTGMPQATTCTVSPNPADVSGLSVTAVMVTLHTTARSGTSSSTNAALRSTNTTEFATLSLSVLPGIVVILQVPRRRRTRLLAVMAAALVLWFVVVGCGGGGPNRVTPSPPMQTGTPVGTYTVVVSGTAGSVTHSFDLKLTVN